MAFGTSAEVQDYSGAGSKHRPGKGVGCLEEHVVWGRGCYQLTAPGAFTQALQGRADPFTLTGSWRGYSKVSKEAVCKFELELLSYEGTLGASDVSFYHARRRKDLSHPFLFSPHIWCDLSQLCLCCWETFSKSGCCLSWSQIPDPRRKYAGGPCALRAKVLVFKSSFSAGGSLSSKAIYWHSLYETNTGVWETREKL